MSAIQNIRTGFSKVLDFETRSSRSEYWWMFLATFAIVCVFQTGWLSVVGPIKSFSISGGETISPETALAGTNFSIVFNGSIAFVCFIMLPVTSRRFKDHGWRGGWFKWAWYLNLLSVVAVAFAVLALAFDKSALFARWIPLTFVAAFIPYASVIWCFWIGFVRPDPNENQYGPNPLEVTQ